MNVFKIGVLASGNGSNFQAIVDAIKRKEINVEVSILICDKADAFVLKRAKNENIKYILIERKSFSSKNEFENAIINKLKEVNVDLVVLAGFMRIISENFVNEFPNKIINIHPSLLPSFPGIESCQQALDYGVKITGVTVHFVSKEVDAGPIILQEPVYIYENDTAETLAQRIHQIEHKLLPQAIHLISSNLVEISARKVKIKCN